MADLSLTATYARDRRTADRDEILRWKEELLAQEPVAAPAPTPAAGPKKPAEAKNPIVAGASTAWDTFQHGAQNIADAIYAKAPMSVGNSIGVGVLGALQMATALPAGAGAAVREAFKNYAPGAESAIALSGRHAEYLRVVLGAPGIILDPKVRGAAGPEAQAIVAAMQEPMTYGEMLDVLTQFAAPVAIGKGLKAMGGKGAAAAPEVQQPASPARRPQGALPAGPEVQALPQGPGTPKALPQAPLVTPPPGGTGGMTPAEVAIELRTALERLPKPESAPERATRPFREDAALEIAPGEAGATSGLLDAQGRPLAPAVVEAISERDRLRAFERTPLDAPARTAKPEGAPMADRTAPTGDLESALDLAIQKTGGAIEAAIPDWAKEEPRPIAGGAFPETEAPPRVAVMDALVHMWADLRDAAPGEKFLLTDELGKVEGGLRQPSTYPKWMDAVTTRRTRGEADKLMAAIDNVLDGKVDGPREQAVLKLAEERWREFAERGGGLSQFTDEAGKIDTTLLARMALGAAAGGTQGDTPEERILGALFGMGLGAAFSKRLAVKLKDAYKESGLADESGAIDFGKWRSKPAAQASEQPYQPNYARLVLTPELARFSKNLHRVMRDEILERKGAPRTHEATQAAAEKMIDEGKMTAERILTLEGDAVLSREEITAARMVAHRSRDFAQKLNEGYKAGQIAGEELMDGFAVAAALSKNVRVAQTRIAQAQEASKIKVGYERPSSYRPEDVIHLADDLGSNMTPDQLSRLLDTIERPAERQKILEVAGVLPRAFLEVMYFSYLSGKAVLRNAIGGLIMPPLAMADMALAPYMPRWGKAAQETRVLPGSATQMFVAYQESMLDMMRLLKFWDPAARKELSTLQDRVGGGRQMESRYAPAITSENFGGGAAMDFLGAVFRTPTNVLGTTDAMAKIVNARMWERFEAFHQATREGATGPEFWGRVDKLTEEPSLLSDVARERVQDFAERQTFTKDFEGRMLGALQRGPEDPWLNSLYRWQVVPFFRTPLRATESGFTHTPVIGALTKKFWDDMAAGGREQQIAQGKMAFGGAVIGAMAYLESQGLITGDGPTDPKLRKQWEDELGWSRRSWWDFVSGKWRSYDGIAPVSDLIAAGADMSAAARRTGGDLSAAFLAGSVAMATAFDTKGYTRTLSEWFDFMRPGTTDDSKWEQFLQMQRQRVGGLFSPGVLREIETGVDPERRRARPSGAYDEGSTGSAIVRELDVMKREWMSQIPGLSSMKDADGNYLIPPDRDRIDGNPTMIETAPFAPFNSRTPVNDPLKRHIFGELQGAGLAPFPEWIGGARPGADMGIGTREAENVAAGVRMTPQEKDVMARLWTQELRDGQGHTYRQALEAALADPDYQNQPTIGPSGTPRDGGKAHWLQRIDQEFHRMAEDRMLEMSTPEGKLSQAVERKRTERIVRKVPVPEQAGTRELLKTLGPR